MNSHFYTIQDSCIQFTSSEHANRSLKRCFSLLLLVVFILSVGAFTGNAQTIVFTGDAEADFSVEGVFVLEDAGFLDVGTPPEWPFPHSGWDMKKAYFFTNLNQLHIGIEYFGIAGDADGDGDPNNSSPELISRGGQDLPNLANSESIAVAIDLDQDGIFDMIAGVPGGDSDGGDPLGCPNFDVNDCFGLYNYFHDVFVNQLSFRFESLIEHPITNQNPTVTAERPDFEFTIDDWNLLSDWGVVEPSTCEIFSFDVGLFSGSFQDDGVGEDFMPNDSNSATVSLEVCADCEGALFGTKTIDLCGVCGGDNSSCGVKTINFTGDPESDFTGEGIFLVNDGDVDVGVPSQIPHSISGWDIKGAYFFTNLDQLFVGIDYYVIAGDSDGDGLPGSPSQELVAIGGQDLPDMAGSESLAIEMDLDQDGTTDVVAGVPGGDPIGSTLNCPTFDLNDCFGLYNHSNNNLVNSAFRFESLIDPIDTLFALPSTDTPDIEFSIEDWQTISGWEIPEPDSCETFEIDIRMYSGSFQDAGIGEDFVPNQIETTTVSLEVCTDCHGLPFGPDEPDECGVCGGDNSSCLDCAGIPNGGSVIDECGVCSGDNSSCLDCAGIPNGGSVIDECGVCGGDNSSCLDCAGIPNGNNFINICGDCSDSNPPFCDTGIPGPVTPTPSPTPEPTPMPEPVASNVIQIAGVTIMSPQETTIGEGLQLEPGCAAEIDGDTYEYPHDFFAYKVSGLSVGQAVQVQYSFPEESGPFDKFFMFGPTPDNLEPHCYEFAFDGTSGAQIMEGGTILLTIIDGGRGDADLIADGTVTDPGGPAVIVTQGVDGDSGNGGGCALSVSRGSTSSLAVNLFVPLLVGLLIFARRFRKTIN